MDIAKLQACVATETNIVLQSGTGEPFTNHKLFETENLSGLCFQILNPDPPSCQSQTSAAGGMGGQDLDF